MKKQIEKSMVDLNRLIEAQNFKTEKELLDFIDMLNKQDIPALQKELLSIQQQAEDLVFEAYELTPAKGKAKIEKALQLNPDCIVAYEYLASLERIPEIASVFYEKGISIGRRVFGGQYLKKHKGMFWGIYETRPFMRCMNQYADYLYTMDKIEEAISIYEEMLVLNPNDNQGVRNHLLLYLIEMDMDEKFIKYAKKYKNDIGAFPFFNRALFAYKTEGETDNANKLLKKALLQNKHVAARLLSDTPIMDLSSSYSFGSEDEADYYALYAQDIWAIKKGARAWLQKHV